MKRGGVRKVRRVGVGKCTPRLSRVTYAYRFGLLNSMAKKQVKNKKEMRKMCEKEIERNVQMGGEFKSEFAMEGCVKLTYEDFAPLRAYCTKCDTRDGLQLVNVDVPRGTMAHKCFKCDNYVVSRLCSVTDIETDWDEW